MNQLREQYGYQYQGFADMSIDEVRQHTLLNTESARAAKQREATEPFIWHDTMGRLDEFHKHLKANGLQLTSGSRFYHVMSPTGKGLAVSWLLDRYRQAFTDTEWHSVALGDSHNDVSMLSRVDYPVLIPNPSASTPDTSSIKNLIRAKSPGPHGWNESVQQLINNTIEAIA